MKLKRKRAVEVPPSIRSFINNVIATPLELIGEPLRSFVWDFNKGDFHQWVDLFNHFDSFFEKYIKSRNDLQVEDNFVALDAPFPKDAVLQILRVTRIILENCTNKHFYSSYEQHLSSLLSSTDADLVEASLQTLAAFLKKAVGKYVIRDSGLHSKLFAFAQGWGGKEEGLGLVACSVQNALDQVAYDVGSTLHFEFYADDTSNAFSASEQPAQGLQIIHLPNVNSHQVSDFELFQKLVMEYKVPPTLRFFLLTRLRFARAFSSLASRQQYTCIRLYALMVLVQSCSATEDLVSFFNTEPEFINELVTLLSYEDAVPEKIRILSLLCLVALCQDRSRQQTVLIAVTSGGHRGILSSLMQKVIDAVSNSSKWSVIFAEALLSFVTVLVSSSSGCSAMREAGFIPTLLPLLKDTDPQHLHLVSTAVHILEAFMDYSNPAAALFRDLGGLDDTISRLKVEVSHIENVSDHQGSSVVLESPGCSTELVAAVCSELDSGQTLYSEALVASHRRTLMKSLLRAISLGTYAPGSTSRIYGSEESLLPHCLCIIFRKAKEFGGGVFSLAATVMSDLIHKDPTCFSVLEAAGLPSAFLDAITEGVLCSAEAITCIPQCLDALCLSNNGLLAVRDSGALRCFVKIFTSKMYLRVLTGDTPGLISSGLDELMRHASSLRVPGVEMLIEIVNVIVNLGSRSEVSYSSNESLGCSTPVPMVTDSEEQNMVHLGDEKSCQAESFEKILEPASGALLTNVELFLPDYITNVTRLLETLLQNSDTCRIFIEKKGIEAVLQFLTLPLMPLSASVGQSISAAFKNFSMQHSVSLVKAVCSFLREHLKMTNELLSSASGTQFAQLEAVNLAKLLRCLSGLDGIVFVCSSLLKGTTVVVSELATSDADVLKEIGRVYREIQWQISLCSDMKVDEKQNLTVESGNADTAVSTASGRESDDDVNIPVVRYMNPVSRRSNSHPQWSIGSVARSGEGFSRRTRHGIARMRGGRTNRHLETLQMDSEAAASSVELPPSHDMKKKSPEVLTMEILRKLSSTLRCFFVALVKSFTLPNRRRSESGSLSAASKTIGTALAKVFLEAFGFSPYSTSAEQSLSVKCRYLGKVVDDMTALIFDSRRCTCYTAMVNNFYVNGTFKELLTTFEATSQLLWTLPYTLSPSSIDNEKSAEGSKLTHNSWLLETLLSYCRALKYFVSSNFLLATTSASQAQLLVQPVAVGLSIGLFPVPRDPEEFVRMLQSQVLEVILPVWNHSLFPNCNPGFISSVISIVTHIYCGVGEVIGNQVDVLVNTNQRLVAPLPDETTIGTIVEMGFTRARAEEALRHVGTNSVEMAMEWLFTHAEDPVQEDDELARALALSLGSSSEMSKVDNADKADELREEGPTTAPAVDDILTSAMKLLDTSDAMAFPLSDLLITLCNRNNGEDRPKITSYLTQQLKICPLQLVKDSTALCMVSHTLALLLTEDETVRDIAAHDGIAVIAIDILINFKARIEPGNELVVPKCITALLLILENLSQSRPKIPSQCTEANLAGSLPDSFSEPAPGYASEVKSAPEEVTEKKPAADALENGIDTTIEKIFGKSTGYLTFEDSRRLLLVACELIKLHVPALVMQALLQICARLTKTHALALQFLEFGGLAALFNIPKSCFFPGYDTVASAIIRHIIEDPQTLQTAMELEIRQTLSGSRPAGRVPVRAFLTSMAPVISRDPGVYMKAAANVCQLESSGGRTVVILSKEKEKSKVHAEHGSLTNECVRITENKVHDVPGKCAKGHKKIPANLTQVVDQLLEILMKYPAYKCEEDHTSYPSAMEVDETITKVKGKTKVDDTRKPDFDSSSEKSTRLVKVTFVLKLLSDILLMYVHAVGVILKRDAEISQVRGPSLLDFPGHGGILQHILNYLVPPSLDKTSGPDEWRAKLSEKASWFLVVLCGRSSEGRRRVISEIVKSLSSLTNLESNSSRKILWPDSKVSSFVELVYSILSKNSSSSNLPGTGCSLDIAKSMIEGGIVQCLSSILEVLDLDHPDASKVVNLILKALEILTRAAHAGEQLVKDETSRKKESISPGQDSDNLVNATLITETMESGQNDSLHQVNGEGNANQQSEGRAPHENVPHSTIPNQSLEQDMRIDAEETITSNTTADIGIDYMRDEMEDGDMINSADQIEMTYHVENRGDNDMGEEDDDMGDDGEDDEEDDEGEDVDEDLAEDGTALMSLADTDVEDHDEAALGDDYNDDMVDEDEDDFPEDRAIEVRWREALDGLDHLQVLGQPGVDSGLIDVAAEPYEGVNVGDLFGLHRPVGFNRQRQINRNSLDQPTTEGNSLQHPLLSRPSQSGDLASAWSSGGNSSRDMNSVSAGSFDVAHLYMFDAPVLPYDNAQTGIVGEQLSGAAQPTLADFSVGLESLRAPGRRAPGAGRWTDDGYPQVGAHAATVAHALEEEFIYQLRGNASSNNPPEIQSHNSESHEKPSDGPLNTDSQIAVRINDSETQQSEDQHCESGQETHCEINQVAGSIPVGDEEAREDNHEDTSNGHDNMEIGEGNDIGGEPRLVTTTAMHSQGCEQLEMTSGIPPNQHDVPFPDVNNDMSATVDCHSNLDASNVAGIEMPCPGSGDYPGSAAHEDDDIDMNGSQMEENRSGEPITSQVDGADDLMVAQDAGQNDEQRLNNEPPNANGIDPAFLEALPEDLLAEVLASQQTQLAQPAPAPTYAQPTADEIDPEFLAALPPDIQAEVLAQQHAQRVAQQAEGQPVEMDNASIIATFPPDLREEVLLTSSEAFLSELPSRLLAEAQMLRERAMSHYQAHSLYGYNHRHSHRRNALGFDRQAVMDRGVGVTIGRRDPSNAANLNLKEVEGEPFLNANALKALIRLLRLAQPLGKGLLQRLFLNLCAHSRTRANLIRYLLDMINPCNEVSSESTSQRLYGCQSNVVYGRYQLFHGLPPLVLRRILETMTYLATNHSAVANILFYFDPFIVQDSERPSSLEMKTDKGKEKIVEGKELMTYTESSIERNVPLILLLKLLSRPLFLRSVAHLEQVMGLLQVVVFAAASKLDCESHTEPGATTSSHDLSANAGRGVQTSSPVLERESNSSGPQQHSAPLEGELDPDNIKSSDEIPTAEGQKCSNTLDIFLQLPQSDLHNLCNLLGHEGLSDKVYLLAGEVLKKLALVATPHRKFFILELSELAHNLSSSAVSELVTLRNTQMLGLSAGSMAGVAILRVLQTLSSLTSPNLEGNKSVENDGEQDELATVWKLNMSLDPLWQEMSTCISATEMQLAQSSFDSVVSNTNVGEHLQGSSSLSPLPPGTQRLLPFIEAFLVLCEKLQAKSSITQQDLANATAREVKELSKCSASFTTKCGTDTLKRLDGAITFMRFAEKHRRLLNAFIRQNPGLLEKSLSMILKAPRLIDFDNKRTYFRSKIRQQHEQHLSGPLRVGVRRAYVLEDSYNQLRMRPTQDLKGRLNVHFQGEEGIDAGGLTREWYQLLSRVIFDKGALLFTTGGNNATFQPNPNSAYQTEHLSYFKFVGRVVAKALYDGQLLDVYFTRSFYKHILGVKVTYHDIEAVDPDYYKNLKWMLENDVSEIPDLTFSMDADEEKHILYEKTEVTEYELKPGGGNIRVTEETKHEYVDLVADHILTNAIRPQINSFLEGFNELIPRELISIFNDKELELLISGLPEIDLDDLKANTEYIGYTVASHVVQWFWEVVKAFNKEDTARFLQFVTGTSKVPLEGFKALQGISGAQKFQIHKAYGAPERLPSAHTCFNQLDLPEYTSKEQLQERLLLAIHEASEGFGFG